MIPNITGLQLVNVNTHPNSFDLIQKHVNILNWFCDINSINDDFTINFSKTKLKIEKIYGLSTCGRFWEQDSRSLLWNRKTVYKGGSQNE